MLGRLKIGLILSLVLLTACSSVPNGASIETQSDPRDPFQNLNRKVHAFNNVVDKNLLMPVVNVYAGVHQTVWKRA